MVGILRTSLDAALPSKGAAAGGDSGDGSKSLDAALPSKGIAAGGDSGDGSDGSTPLPPEVLKGAAAPRDEGGAVPAAVREAVVQRARCGQADYVLEEAADFQGQPFRKCKPALKLVGVDNPQVGGGGEMAISPSWSLPGVPPSCLCAWLLLCSSLEMKRGGVHPYSAR